MHNISPLKTMTLVRVLQKSGVFWVHFTLEKAPLAMDSKQHQDAALNGGMQHSTLLKHSSIILSWNASQHKPVHFYISEITARNYHHVEYGPFKSQLTCSKGNIFSKLKIFYLIFTDYKKYQAVTVSKDCKPSSNYESMCNPVNKARLSLV